MAFDCDLFVIGAGSGGVRAARVAAGHGAKVVVAEEFRVGGTCVIRGCVPKKLLVFASRFADEFAAAAGFGWTVEPPRFDWPILVEAKNREIARLSAAYRAGLDSAGATLIEERATVVDRHTLRLSGGRTISARHILVATGARPEPPAAFPGHELAITSNEVFDLDAMFMEKGYGRGVGVKVGVAIALKRRFSKSKKMSTSNWMQQRLSDRQLLYAANDAFAALQVFHVLKAMPPA